MQADGECDSFTIDMYHITKSNNETMPQIIYAHKLFLENTNTTAHTNQNGSIDERDRYSDQTAKQDDSDDDVIYSENHSMLTKLLNI